MTSLMNAERIYEAEEPVAPIEPVGPAQLAPARRLRLAVSAMDVLVMDGTSGTRYTFSRDKDTEVLGEDADGILAHRTVTGGCCGRGRAHSIPTLREV